MCDKETYHAARSRRQPVISPVAVIQHGKPPDRHKHRHGSVADHAHMFVQHRYPIPQRAMQLEFVRQQRQTQTLRGRRFLLP